MCELETYREQHNSRLLPSLPLANDLPTLMKNTTCPTTHPVRYDVFISHASEDKDAFVRGLAAELARLGLNVWYDETTLTLGDSLRQGIESGLSSSRYGIVVLSHNFFSKNWPTAELDALYANEMEGRKVILPIWHHITKEEVQNYSPLLAGKLAVDSKIGVETIAKEVFSIVKPNKPLPASPSFRKEYVGSSFRKIESPLELLRTLDDVAPLLHKLDQTLSGFDAMCFLSAMQRFFYGCNILTEYTDKNLRFGTDNLLRVLSCEVNDPPYMSGKLATAWACFDDFLNRAKIGSKLSAVASADVNMDIGYLYAQMHSLIDVSASISECDRRCLRLIVALLGYGKNQHLKKVSTRFPEIPHILHQTLREYLSEAFSTQMNVIVPDPLDSTWDDIRIQCQSTWESLREECNW